MKSENQIMLLRDKEIEPTENILKNVLGKDRFDVYQELMRVFVEEFAIESNWRFYKDGKAWLCKAVYKKKTILWLSIWENFIKISFYFTEKTRMGILELKIDEKIKADFSETEAIGKLIALIVDIERKEELVDLKEIIKYKIGRS